MRASTVSAARPAIRISVRLLCLAIILGAPVVASSQAVKTPPRPRPTPCGQQNRIYLIPRIRTDTVPHPACPGAVDVKAKVRLSARPIYPPMFKTMDQDWHMMVQFLIDEHGRVDSSSLVVFDSPNEVFTESIRGAMLRWKGTPAQVDGRAVAQWALIKVDFVEHCAAPFATPVLLRGTAELCVARR